MTEPTPDHVAFLRGAAEGWEAAAVLASAGLPVEAMAVAARGNAAALRRLAATLERADRERDIGLAVRARELQIAQMAEDTGTNELVRFAEILRGPGSDAEVR